MKMNKKKDKNLDAIIGIDTNLDGDIESKGSVRIDGTVIGNIKVKGHLIMGKEAKVEGDINSGSAKISGKVTGNIVAKDKLEFNPNSTIIGDVTTKNLLIASGAVFDGKCNMFDKNRKKDE